MSIDDHEQTAAITDSSSEIQLLEEQVARLREQTATISMPALQPRASDTQHFRTRCFNYNRKGHLQHECPLHNRGCGFCRCLRVWSAGSSHQKLSPGKRLRGACTEQQMPLSPMSPLNINVVMVAAVKAKAAVTSGRFGDVRLKIMLDLGSSV